MRKVKLLDITLFQEADFNFIIRVPDADGWIDITGYSFVGKLKSTTNPEDDPVAEFGFEILDQEDADTKGMVKVTMSAETIDEIIASIATADAPCRQTTAYLYNITMTDTLGVASRIVQGKAFVSPSTGLQSEGG